MYVSGFRPLVLTTALLLFANASLANDAQEALFSRIINKAHDLAAKPYQASQDNVPDALAKLTYDQYRDIRFRPERALWRGQALFEVEFFHLGFLYHDPVTINVVDGNQVKPVDFDPGMFNYGKNSGLRNMHLEAPGFAGLRIHYPLNQADYKDEVISFLGASYFRMLGREQNYGISARGLAIDTGSPKGEEFPRFREFWLVRPAAKATSLTLYALLDSKSVTGAYRMHLIPGANTILDVEVHLFARSDIDKLGVAPLTSMFQHGENRVTFSDDYRPEVHDSDGLLMQTSRGEWIWRPLTNPNKLRITALLDKDPQGFGLVQRDRQFSHYLDLETRYETHPSLWVTPLGGNWGEGAVQLVEIPAEEEINDNIVAFWAPDKPFRAGEERTYRYRLETFGSDLPSQTLAQVKRTRIGWGAIPGSLHKPPHSVRQFIVDFTGGELPTLTESQPVQAVMTSSSGVISHRTVQRLPEGQGWRVAFKLEPQREQPADMRLYLTLRGRRISETWNYVWYSDALQ